MATTRELDAARMQGKSDWLDGVHPVTALSKVSNELYEAWYDGWEYAAKNSEFMTEEDFQ